MDAVAVRDGEIVASAGDPELVTFMRSAAKPIQAGPLARARADLDQRDLAIASASHLADDAQLEAVRALLAKAPATEDDLECGPFEGSKLRHNCSGKHAGMLALCHANGWPYEGYRLPDHPCQQTMLSELASLAGTDEIRTALDGCGVVTFALPLRQIAIAFAGVDERVAEAMRAYPELIRGPQAPDTILMQTFDGLVREGRGRGAHLRSVRRRAFRGAEGRGRQPASAQAGPRFVPGHARTGRVRLRPDATSQQPRRTGRRGESLVKNWATHSCG